MKTTDIVIVGAGIAGLTAAIYLKRANANFIILENKLTGGLLNELKSVDNFPGFPSSSGAEILAHLTDQIKSLGIEITTGGVQTILKQDYGFEVKTDVDSYQTKAVIIATGRNKKESSILGESKYVGSGVSYCAICDGTFFKNQNVAVLGNNDVALEEALYLTALVRKLYFICPDNELYGSSDLIMKIKESKNVEILLNTKVDEIVGDDFGVTSIKIGNRDIDVFGVFPYLGQKTTSQIINNLKPNIRNNGIVVDEKMMTNIEGLFAAGDTVDKVLRQLVTASSDGAIAATSAFMFVKQKQK